MPAIDAEIRAFIAAQPMYFVASAPSSADGHVNVSPKGHPRTFRVIDDHTVAYLDMTGSGAETIAHARDSGRVTIMFCAFSGPPNIVRLYGRASPVMPGQPRFSELVAGFPEEPGVRAVILVNVVRVSESCGWSVPFLRYDGERPTLRRWSVKKGVEGLRAYRARHNAESIDGLPAVPVNGTAGESAQT